jgi:H/ACA ribonucleoprotein complex non-core subunit NAF1
MRDQDMMTESVLNKSAFDEHGPYDLDYGAGPSRPTPKPYDDPSLSADDASPSNGTAASSSSRIQFERSRSRDRSFSQQSEGWGRGRGGRRGKRANNHPRGSSGRDGGFPRSTGTAGADAEGYDPRMPQESLPSPLVQGQNSNYAPSMDTSASWDYPSQPFGQLQSQQPFMFPGPSYQTPYAQPSAFVQPHINPRFASTFGFQVAPSAAGYAQGSPMGSTPPGPGWAEQWTVPTTEHTEPKEDPIP